MRFLVVDDNSVDRHFLTALLEKLGHQVDASDTTEGMLEKIATGNYASVFLDIVMPDRDGYKFLREIRSNQSTAKQHVTFCSSKKSILEINYGLKQAGANEYLIKPIKSENLTQILQRV